MDLLTERRLRDMLALRRIREATLLRDSDKVPELMNLYRRSDIWLGPPVCLRLADRMGAVAKGVRTGGSFWSRNKTRPLRNNHAGQRPRRLVQSAGMEVRASRVGFG